MGLFFSKPMILNELVRTGPNGEKENLDDEEDKDEEDIENPPDENEETPDTGAPTEEGDEEDEDLGGDMPSDDEDEDNPPEEGEGTDDEGDLGDDMPSDDDDEGTVDDNTDYNIPDDGDLGDDMPSDDDEGVDDAGDDVPPDTGEDDPETGGGEEDEGDLGDDMPSDDDGSDSSDAAGSDTGNADTGDTGDTDDGDTADGGDSEGSTGQKTAEEIEAIEKDLFSDLTDEQMAIKHVELKSNFIDLYESIGDIIERVNKIPKTDFNIKSLEFVGIKLNELRTMIHYNLTEGYQTRGYTENMMIYQQCLVTLNTISQLLDELAPEKQEDDKQSD